ncbi:MAG: putative transcriptional regulator, MarR family [Parcubacteria group bacterium]|nr:putative transcriptional regulator, MarR family [Parcubacteria group bacterium]
MTKKPPSDMGELSSLMFEMGRKLKHQISVDGMGPSTYLHLETLRHIQEVGQPDMQAVADYLRIKSPSATRLIHALVSDGLLKRIPDANDRRRIELALTPAGVRMLEKATRKRAEAFARVIEPLSSADRKEFARLLTIITRRS